MIDVGMRFRHDLHGEYKGYELLPSLCFPRPYLPHGNYSPLISCLSASAKRSFETMEAQVQNEITSPVSWSYVGNTERRGFHSICSQSLQGAPMKFINFQSPEKVSSRYLHYRVASVSVVFKIFNNGLFPIVATLARSQLPGLGHSSPRQDERSVMVNRGQSSSISLTHFYEKELDSGLRVQSMGRYDENGYARGPSVSEYLVWGFTEVGEQPQNDRSGPCSWEVSLSFEVISFDLRDKDLNLPFRFPFIHYLEKQKTVIPEMALHNAVLMQESMKLKVVNESLRKECLHRVASMVAMSSMVGVGQPETMVATIQNRDPLTFITDICRSWQIRETTNPLVLELVLLEVPVPVREGEINAESKCLRRCFSDKDPPDQKF